MIPRWWMAVAAVLSLLAAVSLLYWSGRRDGAAVEQRKTAAAKAEAAVSALETEGARATVRRVDVIVRQTAAATQSAARATQEALKAEDAHAPLDPHRADRLRAHDRELCLAAPELAGCAAD
ncbi:hypothetical protein [Phenylobacterium sp.]|jgi:hypothetical protein|uniref:hypothetical protein n=1 Tax=Phenylobacterium sp. TaxID=1871053 RepID=UPI002F939328